MLVGIKIEDSSLCTYCKSKEHQKLTGVTVQHDKNKVLFKRVVSAILSVLANMRSTRLMTHCGAQAAGDALKTVSTEKNPFTENLERTKMYLVRLRRCKDRCLCLKI